MRKKKFRAVELNYLDQETIDKIREWRNQDFVRKMMISQEIISTETHRKWIENIKNDENKYLFVFYLDDEPFAVAQYSYNKHVGAMDSGQYLINEDDQWMGYGVIAFYYLQEIIHYYLHCNCAHGMILEYNKRALQLNKRQGVEVRKTENYVMVDGKNYSVYEDWSTIDMWEKEGKQTLRETIEKIVELEYDVII